MDARRHERGVARSWIPKSSDGGRAVLCSLPRRRLLHLRLFGRTLTCFHPIPPYVAPSVSTLACEQCEESPASERRRPTPAPTRRRGGGGGGERTQDALESAEKRPGRRRPRPPRLREEAAKHSVRLVIEHATEIKLPRPQRVLGHPFRQELNGRPRSRFTSRRRRRRPRGAAGARPSST